MNAILDFGSSNMKSIINRLGVFNRTYSEHFKDRQYLVPDSPALTDFQQAVLATSENIAKSLAAYQKLSPDERNNHPKVTGAKNEMARIADLCGELLVQTGVRLSQELKGSDQQDNRAVENANGFIKMGNGLSTAAKALHRGPYTVGAAA